MFSTNQHFKISGDLGHIGILKKVIGILHENYHFNFKGYSEKDGNLVFYNYIEDDCNVTLVDKDNQNTDYIVNLILLHMSSKSFKDSLNKLEKDSDYLDGSSLSGWVIEVIPYSFSECVVIKPFWVFYSK